MFTQIMIGTSVIFVTIVVQVLFISIASKELIRRSTWLAKSPYTIKMIVSLVAVILWLIIGISLSAWSWSVVFLYAGIFDSLEPALYFSIVTFTTLGYGDITLNNEWRILASFAAVNGLIIFGLNTAFLVEFTGRLRVAQEKTHKSEK